MSARGSRSMLPRWLPLQTNSHCCGDDAGHDHLLDTKNSKDTPCGSGGASAFNKLCQLEVPSSCLSLYLTFFTPIQVLYNITEDYSDHLTPRGTEGIRVDDGYESKRARRWLHLRCNSNSELHLSRRTRTFIERFQLLRFFSLSASD